VAKSGWMPLVLEQELVIGFGRPVLSSFLFFVVFLLRRELLEPWLFFWNLSQSTLDHAPPRNLKVSRPFLHDRVSDRAPERVGEHNLDQTAGEHNLDQTLARDRPSESVVGQSKEDAPAPIKMVNGSPWSPNVYRNLRLIGMGLDEAWKKAFIRVAHF
jgi:hypothetical protein